MGVIYQIMKDWPLLYNGTTNWSFSHLAKLPTKRKLFISPLSEEASLSWCESKESPDPLNPLHRAFSVDVFLFLGTAYSRYLSFCRLLFGPFFSGSFFKCCPAFLKGDFSLICQIKPTTAEGSQTGTQTNLPANRHNESEATGPLDTGEIFISYSCKWRVNKFTVSCLQSF